MYGPNVSVQKGIVVEEENLNTSEKRVICSDIYTKGIGKYNIFMNFLLLFLMNNNIFCGY